MKTLKLTPEAFNDELLSRIKPDQLNWSGDEHIKLVRAIVGHLKDEEGHPIELENTRIEQTMHLIFRPTEELQRSAWKQAFADAGYQLEAEADHTFLLLLNAAQFAKFLSKTENPATKKPFIVLEKKKGAKKDTFAALMKAAQPKEPTPIVQERAEMEAEEPVTENPTATEKPEDSVETLATSKKLPSAKSSKKEEEPATA